MYCANCGHESSTGVRFCPNCGAEQTAAGSVPAAPQAVAHAGARAPTTQIDFRRLGSGDFVAAGATILLFISLFLPWYSLSLKAEGSPSGSTHAGNISALGTGAGGWRFLILVVCLLILGYLFARTMLPRGARLPLPHWQLLTFLTAVNALLTLVAFLVKPGSGSLGFGSAFSVSWSYGAFIGLVATVIAFVGGLLRRNDPEIILPSPLNGAD